MQQIGSDEYSDFTVLKPRIIPELYILGHS